MLACVVAACPAAWGQIANQFPGDVGIEAHPNVIFVDRLNDPIATIVTRYEQVVGQGNMSSVSDVPPNSPHTTSLQMANASAESTHLLKNLKTINAAGYTTLYVRAAVKFTAGGAWHHNGIWVLGHSGDPNFLPSTCCTLPVGNDKFHSATERLFRSGYTTWMGMKNSPAGQPDTYYGNSFAPDPAIPDNVWHTLEIALTLNTPTTSLNGTQKIWVDGVLIADFSQGSPLGSWNVNQWTTGAGATPFEGFRWRSDAALTISNVLLNHYTDGAATMRWSHLVIATAPIGPISSGVSPGPPTNLRIQ
jgi:hypothetical protein